MPLVYSAAVGALVVAVLAIAYGAQAPTFGVAEFAPAAQQQVDAPPTTAADTARGGTSRGSARATTTTQPVASATSTPTPGAAVAPTTTAARTRACYGSPPRQLPDPRSPACLATIYEGDNGGATSAGVTATEIRVGWPVYTGFATDERYLTSMRTLLDYFSHNFELYGRRLVLVPVPYAGGGVSDPGGARAHAAQVGAAKVFSAIDIDFDYWMSSWFQELARQHVVAITTGSWSFFGDREMFDPLHPYLWSVAPSAEQIMNNLGDFACRSLVGRLANHAGQALQNSTRKFGILTAGQSRAPNVRPLVDLLSGCDATPEVVEWTGLRDSANSAALTTAVARLRDRGVTSMICICADQQGWSISSAANTQGWQPEWLYFPHPAGWDESFHQSRLNAEQRTHTFGIQPVGKVGPLQARWWWRAVNEMGLPNDLVINEIRRFIEPAYDQLLVLAAGIQAAGPNLTPDSFAQGLMATTFPNSDAGRPPEFAPSVGFGPGDHSFVDDYALVWWNEAAEPYGPFTTQGKGSWCYLSQGARYEVGQFPADADARFFSPSEGCR